MYFCTMSVRSCTYRLHFAHFISHCFLYPVLCYLVHYRRKVVRENLHIAFPDKNSKECRQLEKAFYRAFADMIMEVLVGRHFSETDMRRLVHIKNKEEVAERCKQYGGGFFMLGHFLNWEWAVDYANQFEDFGIESNTVYKPLSNKFFDKKMLSIRKQRGGTMVPMDRLLRTMVTNRENGKTSVYAMLADQRPRKQSAKIQVIFMGQEVGMLVGSELLARRFEYPVYYAFMSAPEPGHYEVDFQLIYDPTTEQNLPQGTVTERFTRCLEKNILLNPSRWLWSHRRFLHAKPHHSSPAKKL